VSEQGFIYLHRKLRGHWIFEDAEFLKAWVTFLFAATHQDCKLLVGKQFVDLKRGQFVYGRKAFCTKIGISENRLRRFVKLLEIEQMINQQKTNKYSIISIANYDDYQTYNQETTNKAPTNHQQTTTNNNIYNNNNNNKPTLSECQEYFDSKGFVSLAEEFFEHWEGQDWISPKTKKPLGRWKGNAATWITNHKKWHSEPQQKKTDEFAPFVHPIYGELQ